MRKILVLITLVVLLVTATACERPGLTETAVPDGWLLRSFWPSAVAAPAAEGWVEPGWLREALVAKLISILLGLLILVAAVSLFFVFGAWLRRGKVG